MDGQSPDPKSSAAHAAITRKSRGFTAADLVAIPVQLDFVRCYRAAVQVGGIYDLSSSMHRIVYKADHSNLRSH